MAKLEIDCALYCVKVPHTTNRVIWVLQHPSRKSEKDLLFDDRLVVMVSFMGMPVLFFVAHYLVN